MISFDNVRIGYAMCGSFCTFEKSFAAMAELKRLGADITVIMSSSAASVNSRFGTASENISRAEEISGRRIIGTIEAAEPVGPKHMFDLLICSPCTGNTIARLSRGITDTPVTMAVKSHLRNSSPVCVCQPQSVPRADLKVYH